MCGRYTEVEPTTINKGSGAHLMTSRAMPLTPKCHNVFCQRASAGTQLIPLQTTFQEGIFEELTDEVVSNWGISRSYPRGCRMFESNPCHTAYFSNHKYLV